MESLISRVRLKPSLDFLTLRLRREPQETHSGGRESPSSPPRGAPHGSSPAAGCVNSGGRALSQPVLSLGSTSLPGISPRLSVCELPALLQAAVSRGPWIKASDGFPPCLHTGFPQAFPQDCTCCHGGVDHRRRQAVTERDGSGMGSNIARYFVPSVEASARMRRSAEFTAKQGKRSHRRKTRRDFPG